MLTADSVDEFSAATIDLLKRELPAQDCLFSLSAALSLKKILFKNDGAECGALLYDVVETNGHKVFFIGAFVLDAKKAGIVGDEVYRWIEDRARALGCDLLDFDSPRRGMLHHAKTYGWQLVNIRYQKRL